MIPGRETTLRDIDRMRVDHISSLPEFQDLFLKLQIPDVNGVDLPYSGTSIGYTIIKESVMLEFFLVKG